MTKKKKLLKLLGRKVTFLLIPHHSSRPLRLSFSVSVLSGVIFFCLVAVGAAALVFLRQSDYREISRRHEKAVRDNAFFTGELHRLQKIAEELEVMQEGIQSFSDYIPREQADGRGGEGGFSVPLAEFSPPVVEEALGARAFRREVRRLENRLEDLAEEFRAIQHTPLIWPAEGRISSAFGNRRNPFSGRHEFHSGIDIANERGTPIIAPAAGVVSGVEYNRVAGRLLTIDHGGGLVTRYAHCEIILVSEGDAVARGQEVARIGNTGRSTGPHLHYEVHLDGRPVNPWRFMVFRSEWEDGPENCSGAGGS